MYLPFRLYRLPGCGHCVEAEKFLVEKKLPHDIVDAVGDPIISAGVKALTGGENYPVLLSRLTSQIIIGHKPEDYERVWKVFDTLVRTGALDLDSGQQQPQPTLATEVSNGAT